MQKLFLKWLLYVSSLLCIKLVRILFARKKKDEDGNDYYSEKQTTAVFLGPWETEELL